VSAAAPEKSSNFYLGFLFLGPRRRAALAAVYAFARHVDDIVDSGELSKEEAAEQIAFWKEEVTRLRPGQTRHPISKRLAPFVEEFDLPQEGLLGLVEGMALDLQPRRYENIEDLEKYLYGAAGTVGLLCINIFGYEKTPAADMREYAIAMGNALQLTNIMRDVGADLECGRIYLPRKEMEAAGYSLEELQNREHNAAFSRLMEALYVRAKGYYRQARSLAHPGDRRSLLPAEVMAHVYEDVLETMRAGGFRVFFAKTRISKARKLWLTIKAWLASRGIY
jgi:phytoene synthase